MAISSPRKLHKYSFEFKLKAVQMAVALLVLCVGQSHAIQPLAQGLQPVIGRLQAISAEQKGLNLTLRSTSAAPADRAAAYRAYKRVDQERVALECALARGRLVGQLPLVTYASDGGQSPCPAPDPR